MKQLKLIYFVILLFLLNNVGSGLAQPSGLKEKGKIYQQERKKAETINLNLSRVSLRNTLELLTSRLGKNFMMDPEVTDRKLNMALNNITAMEAFSAILESNNLGYRELEGNVFFITKAEKIGKQTLVKNISCKYARAEELQKILESVVVSEFGTVVSDKRTNTLIIKESPDVLAKMERLITELDRPVNQVYIQAAIAEISTSDETELGVEWFWKNANYKSVKGQVGTNFGQQINDNEVSGEVPFPIGEGLGIGILHTDINAVLHAISEQSKLKLLSRPRLITMDNQQSVIEVGDQIPYKVLNEFGVTSFEFKDATVQLLVTPHIIDSEYIMLEVAPKADFQNGATPDGTPIIATRKAFTKVKVKNGQTIVIGGLMRDSRVITKKKVPILGSIPLLGFFFKSKKSSKIKTELIVFITPIILEDEMPPDFFKKDFLLKHKLQKEFK